MLVKTMARAGAWGRLSGVGLRRLARRRVALGVEETVVIDKAFRRAGYGAGTMIDVGAHTGGAMSLFLKEGWRVHAFEPDPANRNIMFARYGDILGLSIQDMAVSDVPRERMQLYVSELSSGISSLSVFHWTHRKGSSVRVTTLAAYAREQGIGSSLEKLQEVLPGPPCNTSSGTPGPLPTALYHTGPPSTSMKPWRSTIPSAAAPVAAAASTVSVRIVFFNGPLPV